jgi:glycyl-tRNA synthetase
MPFAENGRPDMETIASLAKRRGFVFPSAEIYGGFSSSWDFGPLGAEMKRNIREAWWRSMVRERDDVVGLEAALITNPRVWEASGHVSHFTDPLVDCRNCKERFRADELDSDTCPSCGKAGALTEARQFNLMFKTFVGPVEEDAAVAYLPPETAQGMFVNFENVLTTTRKKLPFGIAQIRKSFRNEITPGNFIFRTREFEQMELEFFVKPGTEMEWYDYWRNERLAWYRSLGIREESIRLREYPPEELAHYSSGTTDVEFLHAWGWTELEGVASRTDYDMRLHAEHSGRQLSVFDEQTNEHIVPYVVEPAAGLERTFLALLVDAYAEEQDEKGETRVVLRLHPAVAPIKVAVLPLSRNEKLAPLARQVYDAVRPHFMTQFDDAQSIGRRYRRQDEIGTPLCVTVDFDSLEDNAVTIRERDSMAQARVPVAELVARLREQLAG